MTTDNTFDALIALDPELAAALETAGAQSGTTLSPATVADIIDTLLRGISRKSTSARAWPRVTAKS